MEKERGFTIKNKDGNIILQGSILVKIIKSPISERYCNIGDIATLDITNTKIRCGGAWFIYDDRWIVEPI